MRGRQSIYSILISGFNSFDDHIFEQNFKRHAVAATLVGQKKFTVARKNPIIVGYMVFIIVPMEGQVKLIELKVVTVFSISLCFFQLADQSVIHDIDLLLVWKVK